LIVPFSNAPSHPNQGTPVAVHIDPRLEKSDPRIILFDWHVGVVVFVDFRRPLNLRPDSHSRS